jgi:hypothetical protein
VLQFNNGLNPAANTWEVKTRFHTHKVCVEKVDKALCGNTFYNR